jgi:predicted metal-dependent TIM-barrel fold hydrolase
MSKLDIEDIKASLKEIINAAKKDSELKALLVELSELVSDENTSGKRTRVKVEVDINPISLAANEGIDRLVEELEKLEIEQLVAVIKKYGLDKTRKSYKWKTKEKLVSLIKDKVSASSTRGDVFFGGDKSA